MRYRRLSMPGACYFFTFVTHERAPIFSESAIVALYKSAMRKVQIKRPFMLEAEVVLPDHIHALWTLPEGDADYVTRIRLVKSAFTRALLSLQMPRERSDSRLAKGEQAAWQRRYWEHLIRNEKDFQAHVDYIHYNPVKHGLAAAAKDWPHSTFRAWAERGVYDPWWGSNDMPPLPEWAGKE